MDEKQNLHPFLIQYLLLFAAAFILDGLYL